VSFSPNLSYLFSRTYFLVTAVQIEYSPWALDIENPKIALLKTCRELGVAVVAYSPLGRGFLTGQIKSRDDFADDDFRKISPRFSEENFHKNLELVNALKKIAEKKGCTAGQLSLAWLLAQGDDVTPTSHAIVVSFILSLGGVNGRLFQFREREVSTGWRRIHRLWKSN
jgi:aryl-alcohol dehydrogenase-like predicted oxidoreductase